MPDREPPDAVRVGPEEVRALAEGERSFWFLALLVQAAFVFTSGVYVAFGAAHRFLLRAEPVFDLDEKLAPLLTGALAVLAGLAVLGAFLFRPLLWKEVVKRAGRSPADLTVTDRYVRSLSSSNPLGHSMLLFLKCSIIVLALAGVPGVLGLLLFLITGEFDVLVVGCTSSILAKSLLFGTRERFIALMEERLGPHGGAR